MSLNDRGLGRGYVQWCRRGTSIRNYAVLETFCYWGIIKVGGQGALRWSTTKPIFSENPFIAVALDQQGKTVKVGVVFRCVGA